MRRPVRFGFVTALAAGLAVSAAAQSQPQSRNRAPVSAVHTVRVDAIVTNARGAAVSTLTSRDFELREDGRAQAIDAAQFVRGGDSKEPGAAGATRGPAVDGAPTPVISAADELREARRPGTRLMAIYLDEYHIAPGMDADRARDALIAFIDRELGPGDLVAVLKPLDSLLKIRFTHDRGAARTIVSSLEGRRGDYTPRNDYERNFMAGTTARIESARTQVAISALNALAFHMGALNDLRKTMLVVSEGFDRPPRRRGQEYLATAEAVTRSANRANVSIYPVDPRPASARILDDDDALPGFATSTDGRTTAGTDDLAAALHQAAADANAYYIVTYHADHEEDGAFHAVELRVKRAGLQVRARNGFWAPSADDRLRAELIADANRPRPSVPIEPAPHSSPLIRPWFGWALEPDGQTRVTFVWEPSLGVPGDRGRAKAVRVDLTVLGDGDAVLFKGPVLPTGPGVVDDGRAEPSRAVFDSSPGRLRVRMTIEDASGKAIDSDVRSVQVNDSHKPVSLGTPEVLRARNAREFRTVDEDPAAVPVSAREFRRTEQIQIRVPAYGPEGKAPVVSARLLARLGQAMRELPVQHAPDGVNHEIDVPLAGLAPGDYIIEVAAKSAAGEAKDLVGFKVTN
jgi:VWFA-related protein